MIHILVTAFLFSGHIGASPADWMRPSPFQPLVQPQQAAAPVADFSEFPPCAKTSPDIDPAALQNFLQAAADSDTSSLILIKDGCTVLEKYFGGEPSEAFSVQSVSKSVASLTIGILIDHHSLDSLDMPLTTVFPQLKADAQKQQISFREILSQTSGLGDWDVLGQVNNGDLLGAIFATPLKFAPGAGWLYSSMAVYLLGPSITSLAHQPAESYIQQNLFDPLDIHSAHWAKSGDEIDTGGGLYLQSRDMVKLGNLILHKGEYGDHQVVSTAWLEESMRPSQTYFPGYGLLWWLYDPSAGDASNYRVWSAVGYQGQYITVYPSANLIAVRTHRVEQTDDPDRQRKIFWEDFPEQVPGLLKSNRVAAFYRGFTTFTRLY